jgi:hypothetical protein
MTATTESGLQEKATQQRGNGQIIADPGDQPASKYATPPRFSSVGVAARGVSVEFDKPRTYFRSLLHLRANATFVDMAKPTETGKRLYLISPEAIAQGALNRLPEAYDAWVIPIIDRDLECYLWAIREFNRDGAPIDVFGKSMEVLARAQDTWIKIWWKGKRWEWEAAPNQDAMGKDGQIVAPPSLATIDDWIEAALPGRIIKEADAEELERLRGKI